MCSHKDGGIARNDIRIVEIRKLCQLLDHGVGSLRGYVVIRRSAEEMLSIRRLMVHEADTDTDDTDVF